MPIVGAPDVERSFGQAHATLALTVFLVPGIIALCAEPVLFLLADRYPRRWFICGGLAAMSAGIVVAATAQSAIVFSLAISVVWFASGTACGLAQATLVDRSGDQRGRMLARWTMWSLAGDLVAPVLLALLAVFGLGWRAGFVVVGLVIAIWLVALAGRLDDEAPKPAPEPDGDDGGKLGIWAALREALRDRVLVAWLFGETLCDLLDEILVVFASIHLRVELGAGVVWQSAAVVAVVLGGALGLVACDWLLRKRSERTVLVATALATIACYVPWLLAPTPLVSTLLLFPLGACIAPLYPLTAAQAYARRPNASGSVLAAGQMFTPIALALPFLIGAVADHAGTYVALALLVVQPLGLLVLVAATRVRVTRQSAGG